MPDLDLAPFQHGHAFVAAERSGGERRTRWVVALTLAMMVGEIAAGVAFGSMALLADGWHMGTHAAALGVAAFAYAYARRHASDPRYSFGTGKVGALGGFASAVGLAVVALLVLVESLERLASPVRIRFDQAIAVNPKHEVSRLNKGIVLFHDLQDIPGAIRAWEGLLEINPVAMAPGGMSVDQMLQGLKRQAAQPPEKK